MARPPEGRGDPGQAPTMLAESAGAARPDAIAGPSPGARLAGRFEVGQRLGEGGAGAVFAARDALLGEPVALKLLHTGADLAALRAEVRAARRIAHPNVCRVHDLCEHEGQVFVVMELLSGESLRRRLRRPLPVAEAFDVARQLAAALGAAHRVGVVHCDVKPENTMLTGERVVLTDFGIARLVGDRAARHSQGREITWVEGTPAYMAPEQLTGQPLDQRTDVYALAAVIWEMLAGGPPLGNVGTLSPASLVRRILDDAPVPPMEAPEALAPAARAAVWGVLARALAKRPEERPESTEALIAALLAAAGPLPEAAHRAPTPAAGFPAATPPPTSREDATQPARPRLTGGDLAGRTPHLVATGTPVPSVSPTPTPAPTATPTPARLRARGQRRVASVLHLAMAQGADVDEELIERADAWLAAAEAALADAGAAVVGRGPDALVAVFGASTSRGDEPALAAEIARAVLSAAPPGVTARAGVDAGRLLVREEPRLAVSGEALAGAAQLATRAPAGEVLLSPRAARHVGRLYQLEPAGDALRLGARRPPAEALPAAPLVGREDELHRALEELARPARSGTPGAALLVGPPGIGKSRLRRELGEILAAAGLRTVAAAAEPGHTLASYGVLRQLLRRLCGLGDAPSHEEAEAAARRALAGAEPGTGRALGALAEALAALLAGGALPEGCPAAAAARAALAAAARHTPLFVVVDDAHWADDATLEVCGALARGEVDAAIALVVVARPELFDRVPRLRGAFPLQIALAPLPRAAATALAAACLGGAGERDGGAAAAMAGVIADAADGNPLFVEELAADLRERGGAAGEGTPSTVEEVVQARLDRLTAPERELLRTAAVLGPTFSRDALAATLAASGGSLDARELDACLAALEDRRLLAPLPPDGLADERWRFGHALVCDVAYRELPPATRRAAHAAAAEDLRARMRLAGPGEATLSGSGDEVEATPSGGVHGVEPLVELARHLEGAERAGEAAGVWRRAGELAAAQAARGEAWRCLARARQLAGDDDDELLVAVGEAALEAGAFSEACEALDKALARLPAGPARAAALLARAGVARQLARWDEALEQARAGLAALGDERAQPALAARLHGLIGWILGYVRGDNAAGLPASLRAVELLTEGKGRGTPADQAAALSRLGGNYMRLGRWRDQLECNRRTLELAESVGSIDLAARAHLNLGVNLDALGELDEALAHERKALALYDRMCALATVGLCRNNLAVILTDMGRDEEAEVELAAALRLDERLGGLYYRHEALVTAARLAVRRGDLAAARAHAEAATAQGIADGVRINEAMGRRVLGAVLSRGGDHDGARRELERALELARGADLGEEARAHAEMARVAWRAGRPEDARQARAEAEQRLRALGAALDLAELDDLGWI